MSSMNVYDELTVIDALNVRLATTGLHTYRLPGPSMETPCSVPMLAPLFNQSYGGKVGTPIQCSILVLCAVGDGVSGPELLFDYTSALGARSVKLALEADPTLGGLINDIRFLGPDTRSYERFDGAGNLTYVGRFLMCELYV
jgi:hypothetical protein